MEPEWGVIIGIGIGGIIRELYLLFKVSTSDDDTKTKGGKKTAITSIVLGLLVIIPFLSLIGLILGIYSFRKGGYKKLAILGIILSLLASILWIATFLTDMKHVF